MEAQTILKMIEEVSPDDTEKMDEIDARVWCFVNLRDPESDCWIGGEKKNQWQAAYMYHDSMEYTRSRDALKAIRPDGWEFQADVRFACDIKPEGVLYRFWAMLPDWAKWNPVDNRWIQNIESPKLPTEELAELHAIIQAIDYERKNK